MKKKLILAMVFSLLCSNVQAAERPYSEAEKQIAQSLEKLFGTIGKQVKETKDALTKETQDINKSLKKELEPGLFRELSLNKDTRFFMGALVKADLLYVLQDQKAHTLLVPTDAAFEKLPEATRNRLLTDKAYLHKVVAHHIYGGNLDGRALYRARVIKSAAGEKVRVTYWKKNLYANKVLLSKPNQKTSNGYYHLIDQVMIPKNLK